MRVYVVTGLDLGWDNVVAVYHNVDLHLLNNRFPVDAYVITETTVQTEVDED